VKKLKENTMKKLLVMMVMAAVAGSASAALVTTTTYAGSGDLTDAGNWDNGAPSNANPGLVAGTTAGSWLGPSWHGFSVRQTGGEIFAAGAGGFSMRGGVDGVAGSHNLLEIDDASNDGSYINLDISGQLTMWNQYNSTGSTGSTLSLLNGYAHVGKFWANSGPKARVFIGNGTLNADTLAANANAVVTMLAGGTGAFNLADQSGAFMNQMLINFEAGSKASFTIASNGVASAQGYWETKIAAGKVTINGNTAPEADFKITDVGTLGTSIELLSTVLPFPAPPAGTLVGPNLIPNGEFDQMVDLVGDSTSWFNIIDSYGSFDIFDGSYVRVAGWEYSAEDPNGLTNHVGAGGLFENSFYLDAIANPVTEQINFNTVADLRHIMTQADALSGATIDAGTTYRLSVDAAGQGGQYDPESGTLTVALTDGVGTPIAGGSLAETLNTWNGVKSVDISGALLTSGSVNVMLDVIGTNSIPGYPTASTSNNVPGIIAKVIVDEVSLVEVYVFSAFDVNTDGAVNSIDVDLANSYLDGSVDGGDDAATRQAQKMAEGLTAAEALDALNLTVFDVDGNGTFNAADVTAIEANISPISIISGVMDGSGNFVVTVDISSMVPGPTIYLKRSTDLVSGSFSEVVDSVETVTSTAMLTDTNAPAGPAFYKVTD
jgi:hypothetical protein